MNHTPGPWTITIRQDGLGRAPNRGSYEIVHNYPDGGGQRVVVGKHTGLDCLLKEDARLIAAAPELLSVLEELVRGNYGQPRGVTVPALDAARAAIAKATGKE